MAQAVLCQAVLCVYVCSLLLRCIMSAHDALIPRCAISKSKARRSRAAAVRSRLWQNNCYAELSDPGSFNRRLLSLEFLLGDIHWALIGQWATWQPTDPDEVEDGTDVTQVMGVCDEPSGLSPVIGTNDQLGGEVCGGAPLGHFGTHGPQLPPRPGLDDDARPTDEIRAVLTEKQGVGAGKALKLLEDYCKKLASCHAPRERNRELDHIRDTLKRFWTSISKCTGLSQDKISIMSANLESEFRT